MAAPVRSRKLRLGDDIPAHCGRCKAERTHQVIALNADGSPASVICGTCRGQHRFRAKKAEARTPAEGGSRRRVEKAGRARPSPAAPARPYSPGETFAEGDWVTHPKFGIGEVTRARSGKIEVSFESGPRLLLHAG